MNTRVRPAKLDDCEALTRVHCSGVTEWFKYVEGEKVADDYRNLGLWDRYLVGGPWMNEETCAVYLNYMLSAGQPVLVAEVDGKVVGEIDVFVGEEPPPLERNACISVLEVAKDFRRKGVGKALVRRAIRLAEESNCQTIAVIPEKDAVGFYRECGLNEVLMELQSMEADLQGVPGVNDEEVEVAELISFEALKTMHMVYGRYDSSFGQWLKRRWKFCVWPSWSRWEEGFVPSCDGAYRVESNPIRKEVCNLLAWTENPSLSLQLLQLCAKRAKKLGFKRLRTCVSKDLVKAVGKFAYPLEDTDIISGKRLAV